MAPTGGRAPHARLAAFAVAGEFWVVAGSAVAGGFYLRGGIGFDRPAITPFTDVNCASSGPAALYSCRIGGDGARLRSTGEFGTG